ncbi:3394_t:CDS:2, partial [Scutellospora calospora]
KYAEIEVENIELKAENVKRDTVTTTQLSTLSPIKNMQIIDSLDARVSMPYKEIDFLEWDVSSELLPEEKVIDEEDKKDVSNDIRQCDKKKILHERKNEHGLIQEISTSVSYNDASLSIQEHNSTSSDHVTKISLTLGQEKSRILQNISHLYEKACDAEDKSIKANQAEILCWSNFIIAFDKSLNEIMIRDKSPNTELPDSSVNNSSDDLLETE